MEVHVSERAGSVGPGAANGQMLCRLPPACESAHNCTVFKASYLAAPLVVWHF